MAPGWQTILGGFSGSLDLHGSGVCSLGSFCRCAGGPYSGIFFSATPATLCGSMLTLSGITKAYGGRTLFADVTLQLNREDRIGLVGPNGAGKSTLFSIILGEEGRTTARSSPSAT
jgi:ABC-type multidrug transport system fused ATPase/permease subunit